MYAVIFEVEIKEWAKDKYLDIAAQLREQLVNVEGFISIERFQSLANEDKLLSLSFWETETAINNWRNNFDHLHAQQQGKEELFLDYEIYVTKVERKYSMNDREQAPS